MIGLGVGIDYALFLVTRHRARSRPDMEMRELDRDDRRRPPAAPWSSPGGPS